LKVLLTGASGQLGQALIASKPPGVQLISTSRSGGQDLEALDLADPDACQRAVHAHLPDWVLNAGAYTAVDQAESEPVLAQAVNADAPHAFSQALVSCCPGGRLLQLSTDFVFNGEQGRPYQTDERPDPLGVYGATKASGEQVVRELLGTGVDGRAAILRTSWVYGPVGGNFLLTMLRLHQLKSEAKEPLRVVADQVGCPTATFGLAQTCWTVIARQVAGVLHWSDAGAATWFDFAVAIGVRAAARGLISAAAEVKPIRTIDYPTPAHRPAYSLLDCTSTHERLGVTPRHWQSMLDDVLGDLNE